MKRYTVRYYSVWILWTIRGDLKLSCPNMRCCQTRDWRKVWNLTGAGVSGPHPFLHGSLQREPAGRSLIRVLRGSFIEAYGFIECVCLWESKVRMFIMSTPDGSETVNLPMYVFSFVWGFFVCFVFSESCYNFTLVLVCTTAGMGVPTHPGVLVVPAAAEGAHYSTQVNSQHFCWPLPPPTPFFCKQLKMLHNIYNCPNVIFMSKCLCFVFINK